MTAYWTLRVALLLVVLLATASPAQAYLDPSTGSMLLSAVIGIVAAVGLGLKMFWYQVVGLVRGKRRVTDTAEGSPSPDK
jgi:hypothetical protein